MFVFRVARDLFIFIIIIIIIKNTTDKVFYWIE